ncbi:SulP family inorganic anion transporter [Aminobacter sp. UC22_36]|uniref:SulP family inorganic anion transporter n=1 Tax=Aminobacter sp. UC22_36 TaxID=3374549 RepID=UPI0037574A77
MEGEADRRTGLPGSRLLFGTLQGWRRRDLGGDLTAALTLAAIAIPEQMATSRLGDFSPEVGFFAFIAGSLAFAAFGASRYLSAGADSTITPIFAGGLALVATAGSPHYGELAAMLALMVGVIVVAGGLLRLGWLADLLSVPVTAGFLAGISVHIVISQLPAMLGLRGVSGDVFQQLAAISRDFGQINLPSVALGLGVFAVVFFGERVSPRIPGALIALVLATLLATLFDLPQHGVAVLGPLPEGLPKIAVPAVAMEDLRTLVPIALLIALVVMVQTAATTRSFANRSGPGPDVNRDFVGVGAGSLLAGMVGAFPVNASPPRTAIVSETGGRSQLAGLFAAGIVLALVLFGAKLLANVPEAALSGVLFFVALRILRWQTFAATWRQAPVEFALILVTAVAIVALPIEIGVATGIVLSLLHGLWGMTQARAIEFEKVPGTSIWWPPDTGKTGERVAGVLVVAFQAPLSFVNAERFQRDLEAMIAARAGELRHVVLECSSVTDIDFTAAGMLSDVIAYCRASDVSFSIARLEPVRAQVALARFGIASQLGADHIFRSVDNAVTTLTGQVIAAKGSQP